MLTAKLSGEDFAQVGDEALANRIRDLVNALNVHLRVARDRNITVTIGPDELGYKVERITVERPL